MAKKYVMGMKGVNLTEFFLYEFSRCQFRAFSFIKENHILKLADLTKGANKSISYRMKKYKPNEEMFKYIILKKIYYKSFEILLKHEKLTLDLFKNIFITIIEKEIKTYKKKYHIKKEFEKFKSELFNEAEDYFLLINEFDANNSVDKFITYKINLKEYLEFKFSKINPVYTPNLPIIDWENVNGEPYFILNLINIKADKNGLTIVMTSPLKVIPEMVHRNFYISFIIEYIYYFYPYNDELKKIFNTTQRININKLIVYYPLEKKREEYTFQQINGVLQAVEIARVLRIYLEKLYTRTNDTSLCYECENNEYCFHRTNAKNKTARKFILNSSDNYKELIY